MSSTMGRITDPPDLHLLFEAAEQRYLATSIGPAGHGRANGSGSGPYGTSMESRPQPRY